MRYWLAPDFICVPRRADPAKEKDLADRLGEEYYFVKTDDLMDWDRLDIQVDYWLMAGRDAERAWTRSVCLGLADLGF